MSCNQKFAWFNLGVIAITLILVFSLVPILGWQKAQGGFGMSGLMGFGVLFFRKKSNQPAMDERDNQIHFRSWAIASGVMFWLIYIFVAVFLAPAFYGQDGVIPVTVVQMSVYWATMVAYTIMSIAILVQYAGGETNVE